MANMTIEVPEEALGALRKSPEDFVTALRTVAAVKWYEMRALSQERAAEVAGVSRAEFIAALAQYGVSPFQYGAEEILEEVERA